MYRIVEFSFLSHSAEKLNELWLYLGDAAPTLIGVLAFAFVLPYDLPYRSIFKRGLKRGGCGMTNMEEQGEVPCYPSTNTVKENLKNEEQYS